MRSLRTMLSCEGHRVELATRIASIVALLDATHAQPQPGVPDVGREARGLTVLLLYAAYERLLVSLCRSVLEEAASLRVGNRRLKPGLKLFAARSSLEALAVSGPNAIWTGRGLDLVNVLDHGRRCTIDARMFPTDGSHMRRQQVATICQVLTLGDPAPVLRDVWDRIDTIVDERNKIAHGAETADEIGRRYTIGEVRALVSLWLQRWTDFLNWVESRGSGREFFRK